MENPMFNKFLISVFFIFSSGAYSAVTISGFSQEYSDNFSINILFDEIGVFGDGSHSIDETYVNGFTIDPTWDNDLFSVNGYTANFFDLEFTVSGGTAQIDFFEILVTDTTLQEGLVYQNEFAFCASCEGPASPWSTPISWNPQGILNYNEATAVPVPAASWLFMSALIGLVGKKQLSRR
jgi:hypothetical protein